MSSFASLIVVAVLALVRVTAVALPTPLQQMAHTLASVHGYRTVVTSTSVTGKQQAVTTQTDTVFLRSGSAQTTYTVETVKIQSQELRIERVDTATRACVRQNSAAHWSCQPVKAPKSAADSSLKQLGVLKSQFQWSAAGTNTINGQPVVGYRAVNTSGAPLHSTATLWMAGKTHLPLELRSTTSYSGKAGTTTLTEVVDWSQWNDPALTVPPV
ncbi:MAG TPA: hypothetical protein VHB98_23880 [Chloroflexota bacterium]|jgi:hypothetical protein|nr:hypothetical protein [Chloroflexota bacterium]